MARLLGVDIPNRKKVEFSLRYIYGVGPTRAKEILDAVDIDPDRRTQELTEQELSLISNYIIDNKIICLLYTSPSPRDISGSRMPSSA